MGQEFAGGVHDHDWNHSTGQPSTSYAAHIDTRPVERYALAQTAATISEELHKAIRFRNAFGKHDAVPLLRIIDLDEQNGLAGRDRFVELAHQKAAVADLGNGDLSPIFDERNGNLGGMSFDLSCHDPG